MRKEDQKIASDLGFKWRKEEILCQVESVILSFAVFCVWKVSSRTLPAMYLSFLHLKVLINSDKKKKKL